MEVCSLFSKKKITVIILIAVIFLTYFLLKFSPYPQFKKFLDRQYSTCFYDDTEELLQITSVGDGLRREWTDYKKIPENVRKYILESEDKRFFFHYGIDLAAVAKASVQNLKAKRTVRGASTITMQLVKIIEQNEPQNKSKNKFAKKLSDSINAIRLETRLTKKQILELYLNNVPFGCNCDGVTTAARTIFGKELSELTDVEICCLAVIPRRPSENNPLINPQLCQKKAEQLYERINNQKIEIDCSHIERFEYPYEMPHYIQFLSKQLKDKNGHLPPHVYLTANLELHNYAQEQALIALDRATDSRISNVSVLVIDNENNSVLVWLGNANWYDSEHSGQVDGVLVKNQPGSSMKPFLYALGLETKYKPTSIIADIPREFGNESVYIPANFNNRFNGPVRYRVALASSLNIPAVTILDEVGVSTYLELLQKMEFTSLEQTGESADLGLALGAGEVSLKELVPAFSVFTRDGKYIPLSFTAGSEKAQKKNIYDTDTARILCSFLSDTDARAKGFGYTQTFQTKYPSIFKTGTSNQYQSIIALGGTTKWTVGVWMGNFSGDTVIGKTGSSLPAEVAKNILDYLMAQVSFNEDINFAEPEHYELREICPVSGMAAGPYCEHKVFEYVKESENLETCSWHIFGSQENAVVYPSEYQQWYRLADRNGVLNYNDRQLKIITPQNNSIFFYEESRKNKLAINLEVIGGAQNILEIEYDGAYYKSVARPFTAKIPVEVGHHVVTVTCGNEVQTLEYQVK